MNGRPAAVFVHHFAFIIHRQHMDDHLSLGGELDGVTDQVEQHPDAAGRHRQPVRPAHRAAMADQFQTLLVCPHGQRSQGITEGRAEREVGGVQFQFAGLDLGEVEQVVEDAQQLSAATLTGQGLPLVVGQGRAENQGSSCP